MKHLFQRAAKIKKATPIDPRLDKLEEFFSTEKIEKAKERLAKAKNLLNHEQQHNNVIKQPA